jgi:ribosomal protein L22
MVNTEKPQAKAQEKKSQKMVLNSKMEPLKNDSIKKESSPLRKEEETKVETLDKKVLKEEKKPQVKKVKKDFVEVNATNVPISTKYSFAICKFIKNKKIDKALELLSLVEQKKVAVPMKGEIPHRKGNIMAGRFPIRAIQDFRKLLLGLKGNASNHEIEDPIIVEAIANFGPKVYGHFGKWTRKRTHIKLVAKSFANEIKKESKNKVKGVNKK